MKKKVGRQSSLRQHFVRLKRSEAGATIVETIVSIVGFTVIVVFATISFALMGRTYVKSVSENKTQEVTRNVVDTITESIRTSGVVVQPLECRRVGDEDFTASASSLKTPCSDIDHYKEDHWKGYCVGNVGYLYRIGQQLRDPEKERAFVVVRSCDDRVNALENLENNLGTGRADDVIELLRHNMRVVYFKVDNDIRAGDNDPTTDSDPSLYEVHLKIAYGGDQCDWDHDSEVFVWAKDETKTPPKVLVPGLPKTKSCPTPKVPAPTADTGAEIIRCQNNQIRCAVSELKTKAYKQIKN